MTRAPNHANAVGCKTTRVTKDTRIIALGHLATHIDAKVALLKEKGYVHAEPMYAQEVTLEQMKETLKGAPNALLFVGGAMGHTHPDTMRELYAFIPENCPTLAVDVVYQPDFAATCPGRTPPFTAEEVAVASLYAIEQIAGAE